MLKTDKIYLIKYFDASFVYDKKLINSENQFPKISNTVGTITKNTENFIELSFVLDKTGKKKEGLVIPKKTILKEVQKTNNFNIDNLINKKISIDWIDINKFYDGLNVEPTKMYSEGVLEKFNNEYLVISNPETIDINQMKNHPIEKPKLYFIPFALVKNIKSYE